MRTHWDRTYTEKEETRVSWYQDKPERSLALIHLCAPDRASPIIDVGGGTSRRVDVLLDDGYDDVTVLDISATALARSQMRLGPRSERVTWIVADITAWRPERAWMVWQDRAVFHFLTNSGSQDAYVDALTSATVSGSTVIMATFALAGPERCSGLTVQRYSPATLALRLGSRFTLRDAAAETHHTPFGTTQELSMPGPLSHSSRARWTRSSRPWPYLATKALGEVW